MQTDEANLRLPNMMKANRYMMASIMSRRMVWLTGG